MENLIRNRKVNGIAKKSEQIYKRKQDMEKFQENLRLSVLFFSLKARIVISQEYGQLSSNCTLYSDVDKWRLESDMSTWPFSLQDNQRKYINEYNILYYFILSCLLLPPVQEFVVSLFFVFISMWYSYWTTFFIRFLFTNKQDNLIILQENCIFLLWIF